MSDKLPISIDDVRAAAAILEGQVENTPFTLSRTLSEITGAEVWLKFDNTQFTASFKERGALNKLAHLSEQEKRAGVIAVSAGNHAQGVAYHGRRLGIPVTIVMPITTPFNKVEHTRAFGARVLLEGTTFEEANAFAQTVRQREGLTWIHPFDDPLIMAGQGTAALEMLAEQPDLDTLVVPIGGGGLISGMATVAKAHNAQMRVIGVQAAMYSGMHAVIKGSPPPPGGASIAEGIAVKKPGELTRRVVEALVDDIVLVEEAHIERAITLYVDVEKTTAEGAGAAGLAALLAQWGSSASGWLAERVSSAGRAAFTNYLGTSVVMLLVFHGWAGGLFGQLGRTELYLVALATCALMLAWSKPWLERFRYGPLEWLWRCLTYGRKFPLRR